MLSCSLSAGTPHYLSPEVCQGQKYDQKSDIWALGCVLYEMCALRKPFDGSNLPAIILSIMRSKPPAIDASYSMELANMVNLLLQPAAEDRPTIFEIAEMESVQARALCCVRRTVTTVLLQLFLLAPLSIGGGSSPADSHFVYACVSSVSPSTSG